MWVPVSASAVMETVINWIWFTLLGYRYMKCRPEIRMNKAKISYGVDIIGDVYRIALDIKAEALIINKMRLPIDSRSLFF